MSWLYQKRGRYHWIIELYQQLKLPIFDGMLEALQKASESKRRIWPRREQKLPKNDEPNGRKPEYRSSRRKSYGGRGSVLSIRMIVMMIVQVKMIVLPTHWKCRCGSADHRSIWHHSCPLNKRSIDNSVGDKDADDHEGDEKGDDNEEDGEEDVDDGGLRCTCGLARASHRRDCPLNPRNMKYK